MPPELLNSILIQLKKNGMVLEKIIQKGTEGLKLFPTQSLKVLDVADVSYKGTDMTVHG